MKTQYRIETENPKTRYGFELYRQTKLDALKTAAAARLAGLNTRVVFEKIYVDGKIEATEVQP